MSDEITSITSGRRNRYVYALGRRIKLTLEPAYTYIEMIKDDSSDIAKKIAAQGTVLPGGATLTSKAVLTLAEWMSLSKTGITRNVYRFENKILAVPLPELRVVFDAEKRNEVFKILEKTTIPFEIIRLGNDQMILRPISDLSEDALDLANYIYEQGIKVIPSARVLRVMESPE